MDYDKRLSFILGLPKTLFVNFKFLPIASALRLPIFVSNRVKLLNTRGRIEIQGTVSRGMIQLGFGGVGIFDKRRSRSILELRGGTIIFRGPAMLGHGIRLSVAGRLEFGRNFVVTAETAIICEKKVVFGDDCLLSWEVLLMDTDYHPVRDAAGTVLNPNKPVIIGNRVWIGCRCTILKGTTIGDGVIVGAGTSLHGTVDGTDEIIGGNPARVLKREVFWDRVLA